MSSGIKADSTADTAAPALVLKNGLKCHGSRR